MKTTKLRIFVRVLCRILNSVRSLQFCRDQKNFSEEKYSVQIEIRLVSEDWRRLVVVRLSALIRSEDGLLNSWFWHLLTLLYIRKRNVFWSWQIWKASVFISVSYKGGGWEGVFFTFFLLFTLTPAHPHAHNQRLHLWFVNLESTNLCTYENSLKKTLNIFNNNLFPLSAVFRLRFQYPAGNPRN